MLMEHQVTVDTGEINTSPVNVEMPPHQADFEESSVISTFNVSKQSKTQKEPFPRDWPRMRAYGAALVGGFAVVPSVAAAITVAIFLAVSGVPSWSIVLLGMLVTFAAWLLISIPMSFLTSRDRVNARSYGLLISRLGQLETRLNVIQNRNPDPDKLEEYQEVALEEAYNNFQELDTMLYESTTRLPWVLGLGYVNAWGRLHRAEEALIDVEPVEMVIRGAYHDKMAITDSQMSNSSDLLNELRTSVKALDPAMGDLFSGVKLDDNQAHKKGPDQPGTKGPSPEAEARLTIREIRQTLNEFRDHLWEGLIRGRNRLVGIIFVTSLATYLLLCVTILSASPEKSSPQSVRPAILAAATFYIIGATAGLFVRIFQESAVITAIDDYGLSITRLLITPLLSGLASVGGVLITALLYGALSGGQTIYSLQGISQLQELLYLLVAAIFGFTPNLVSGRVWKSAESYMSALLSSKALSSESTKENDGGETPLSLPSDQQLEQIYEYEVNKVRRWFGVGVAAAAIGFLVIVGGVAVIFIRSTFLGVIIMLLGCLPAIGAFLAFQQRMNASERLSQRRLTAQEKAPLEPPASPSKEREEAIATESSSFHVGSDKP